MLLSLLLLSMYKVYNCIFHGETILEVVREILLISMGKLECFLGWILFQLVFFVFDQNVLV